MTTPTPASVDKISFEFGELRHGAAAAQAYTNMVHRFIASFSAPRDSTSVPPPETTTTITTTDTSASNKDAPRLSKSEHEKLYQILVRTVYTGLLHQASANSVNTVEIVEASLEALTKQQNVIAERERGTHHKGKKKWEVQQRVISLDESSSESEDDEETLARKQAERELQKQKEEEAYLESCRLEELRELEREENEAELRARERTLESTAAFEALLEAGADVLLHRPLLASSNAGYGKGGKKKGNAQGNAVSIMTPEEWGVVLEDQYRLRQEKEFLNDVLVNSGGKEEEIPKLVKALTEEVAALEAEVASKNVPAAPLPAPTAPNKRQVTEGNGKLQKLTQERNRLMLTVKAIEVGPAELIPKLIEMLQKKAALLTQLQRVPT